MAPQAPLEWPKTANETSNAAGLQASLIQRRTPPAPRAVSILLLLWYFVSDFLRRPAQVRRLGPYLLAEKIGQGGMGVIYRALHPLRPRPCAIKLLHAERSSRADLKRFEREARLTQSLQHPNTVSVLDFGTTPDGVPYYVMEYLDGVDLQTLVEVEGPQSPARVTRVLAQLAGALEVVHDRGLLHGDVKPANVVLCGSGAAGEHVKILDFGLAREIGRGAGAGSPGETQGIVGTPLYLSPEALVDPSRVDGRSDLYALGALGYFLLTGAPPFAGKNVIEVLTQHLHATPVSPSCRLGSPVPRELEALIMRCLFKRPEARPESAAKLRELLLPDAARGGLIAA